MASNDVEVLDPSVAIEKISRVASGVAVNRRQFMSALGVAGAAVGTGLVSTPSAVAQQPVPNGYAQVDVINFLLNLKYLKATLYAGITTGKDIDPSFGITTGSGGVYNLPTKVTFTGTNAGQITDLFNEMYYDEVQQIIALRAAQGTAVVGRQSINLLGDSPVNTSFNGGANTTTAMTPAKAISYAQFLEDLSASAFAGASIYLTGANLQLAAQALASDALHSGAIRLLSIQTGAPYNFQGSTNFSFTAAGIAGSTTIYAFLDPAAPVQVGYQLTTSPTVAITGDKYASSGAGSPAVTGSPSAPGLTSLTGVTAVGTIPSTYLTSFTPNGSSHHEGQLDAVPAALATTWAPGMPVYDSGKYLPNPGTYITAITPDSNGTYTVQISASSGGHAPGHIYVGTTAITLSDPLPNSGAFTASTIGLVSADPMSVLPADIGPGVATTGPALNPAGLPKSALNQGFFVTAGTKNPSAPAGLAFARTFGQVLGVLYSAQKDSNGNFAYEGGFYPVGVSGSINVVS